MSNLNDKYQDIRRLLQQALPPMDAELGRDLWPSMLGHMNTGELALRRAIPWYDWVLAGLVPGALLAFPSIAALCAYYLCTCFS
jgi:hypothetical protein